MSGKNGRDESGLSHLHSRYFCRARPKPTRDPVDLLDELRRQAPLIHFLSSLISRLYLSHSNTTTSSSFASRNMLLSVDTCHIHDMSSPTVSRLSIQATSDRRDGLDPCLLNPSCGACVSFLIPILLHTYSLKVSSWKGQAR